MVPVVETAVVETAVADGVGNGAPVSKHIMRTNAKKSQECTSQVKQKAGDLHEQRTANSERYPSRNREKEKSQVTTERKKGPKPKPKPKPKPPEAERRKRREKRIQESCVKITILYCVILIL
jgi:hypothetical protein